MGDIDITSENIWNLVLFYFREEYALYVLLAGVIISFVLSFSVGANDSANSWGTSVGAGSVSLGWAYFLGSIMELVGCTLLSGDVIKKVVNGIVNIDAYKSNRSEIVGNWTQDGELGEYLYEEKLLGIGCIAVMLGSGIWQLIASSFSWPVSGTHCIIFGLLGFTITAKGTEGIKDAEVLTTIIVFLFVSIIVAMFSTGMFYYPLYKYFIRSGSAFEMKNQILYAILTGLSTGIPVTFIIIQTNKAYNIFEGINFAGKASPYLISLGVGLCVSVVIALFAIRIFFPYLKKSNKDFALDFDLRFWMKNKQAIDTEKPDIEMNGNGKLCCGQEDTIKKEGESPEITRIFRPLQVISAMTSALVHGGNDVANCIGPFVVIYYIYKEGVIEESSAKAPFSIALWGGVGIAMGLVLFGKRVIMTMGTGISEMTASRGFSVEWVASLVVLIFTALGFPLSTTHCKVGGLIGAGLVQGLVETGSPKKALKFVNFRVLSGVLLSWVLTIPFAFGLSSIIFLVLKAALIS